MIGFVIGLFIGALLGYTVAMILVNCKEDDD